MTLAALIQRGGLARVATATSATSATQTPESPTSVARAARVAVANGSNGRLPEVAATPEQEAELRALVTIVTAEWPQDEQAAALAAALADPVDALICYRTLAAERRPVMPVERDDRRTCEECANLDRQRGRDGFRRCAAARRGELPYVASRDYSPVPDLPKRCEGYLPRPDDSDQRTGLERWPNLISNTAGDESAPR